MKVLLASDGSSDSMLAAQFVSRLAKNNSLDVHVLTVTYMIDSVAAAAVHPWSQEWTAEETKRVETLHSKLLALLSRDCHSVVMTRREGHAVHTILQEAVNLEVDLIVLGARGHSMIHRILLGSVSDSVATLSKCSVVVVRTDPDAEELPEGPNKILLGYDRSKGSREAVAELMEYQWDSDASLNLFSVAALPFPFEGDAFAMMDSSWEPDYVESLRSAAERMASKSAESIRDTSVQIARSNHIGDAIVEAAKEGNSDVIVIGDTGHGLLDEWLLGSTSKYVLRHAPCTVWISRHHRKSDPPETASDDQVSTVASEA